MIQTSDAITVIKQFEGFRSAVYDDANGKPLGEGDTILGHPTIGYGFALDVAGLSQQECDLILGLRLDNIIKTAQARYTLIWARLTNARQLVLVNMIWQLGFAGFDSFTKFYACLIAENYGAAADEMLNSMVAQQSPQRWQWNADKMRAG